MKKYLSFRETESILFNLDSMRTHLQVLQYETEDSEEYDKLQEQIEEIENLLYKLNYGLNQKELSKVREIVNERKFIRYNTCLNNGMNEKNAGEAFND